jgi:hypothetical protein
VTDANAGHIGDRVVLAWLEDAHRDAEVARPRSVGCLTVSENWGRQ